MRTVLTQIAIACCFATAAALAPFALAQESTEAGESSEKSTPPNLDTRQLCTNLMDGLVQGIRALKQSAAIARIPVRAKDNTELLSTWTKQSCDSKADRKRILSQAAKFLTSHSYRAGLVLRLTDANAEVNKEILKGYQAAFVDLGFKPEESLVVVDPGAQPNIQAALAKLVLEHEVSLVAGGLDRTEADQLSRWSSILRLPALVMNRDQTLTDAHPQTFRVIPAPSHLAEATASFAKLGMARKIAIMRPNTPEGQAQADAMRAALTAQGILAEPETVFEPDDFESIELAAKKLFKVAEGDRRQEFQKVLYEARIKARKANQAFNPKMVFLPPYIDFDAVFVPVDFRTIRHIARVYQYLGVKELRLLGNYQWRSRALIEPHDAFMERSLFADFVGRYDDLPASIRPKVNASTMFLSQKEARSLDYRLLGYTSGRVAALTLRVKDIKRNILFRSIGRLVQPVGSPYFGSGPVFDEKRLIKWPAQLLKVIDRNIALAGPKDALLPSSSPTPPAQN